MTSVIARRSFIVAGAALLATPVVAPAQSGAKHRIGLLGAKSLGATSGDPRLQMIAEAFTEGLRSHGWVENESILLDRGYAEAPERYSDVAAALVARRPNVLVTALGDQAILALKHATSTIPIVMLVSADPVGAGLVGSLARPGGNVTGMSILAPDMGGKRLEFLKQVMPALTRVAVLWNAGDPAKDVEFRDTVATATMLNVTLHSVAVRAPADFDRALSVIVNHRPEAMIAFSDPLTVAHYRHIIEFSTRRRLPMIAELRLFAEAGGLMSYGASITDLVRRGAGYVDKILKGAKPADLPVQQPTKFELVVNAKTARALGLTIPPSLLLRADQVIE